MTLYRKLPWMALILCAIALTALFEFSTSQVVEAEPEIRFVAVMEDSPDAILLKKADRWSDPIVQLKFNQQVTWMFDVKASIFSKIKVVTDSGTKIGYVKKNCLAMQSQYQGDEAKAMVSVGAASANTAAKGLNKSNENKLRKSDKNYNTRIKQVEANENLVHDKIFGGKPSDNMAKGVKKYRSFGVDGGLLKGGK
ncbi:MAG: hypothetical protein V3V10_06700 [Planctomycetota bacterium]